MQLILGNGSLNERDEAGGSLCIAGRRSAASRTAAVSDFFASSRVCAGAVQSRKADAATEKK